MIGAMKSKILDLIWPSVTDQQLADLHNLLVVDAERSSAMSSADRLTRAGVLDAAREAVLRDRAATHGAPEDAFGRIAAVWSARLGIPVTPAQVCILMIDLKGVRAWGNPGHGDNWVDIAGYAACGGEVAGS